MQDSDLISSGKKPLTRYVLFSVFIFILCLSIFATGSLVRKVSLMDHDAKEHLRAFMDEYSADPGKTPSGTFSKPAKVPRAKVGIYLDRVEDWDIKRSYWQYDFYVWFAWKQSEIDLRGLKEKKHNGELPFFVVNSDIIKSDLMEDLYDSASQTCYIQYYVKARSTQFFDVSLYPVDEHELIIPIEHKWLDRNRLLLVPDTLDSKISSRVEISGYEKNPETRIIEKAHLYLSTKGNPALDPGYKVEFSQLRMALHVSRGGLCSILKLFTILFIAVIVTFISPFSSDPSRYTVGALFTTAGASYILASKLPEVEIYTFAEIVNTVCLVTIITMIVLLAVLPVLIHKYGKFGKFEKNMMTVIYFNVFLFVLVVTGWLIWIVV